LPSPIAHGALALAVIPLVIGVRATPRGVLEIGRHGMGAWWRALAMLAVAAFVCVLPDVDIAINAALGRDAFATHGLWTHGVVWAPLGGVVLGLAAWALRWPVRRAVVLGVVLLASHGLMDMVTRGRGAAVLWPFVPGRVSPPVELFAGVRHSSPGDLAAHARTVLTEGVFALAVWGAAALIRPGPRGNQTGGRA
jgi:hypothetical protein